MLALDPASLLLSLMALGLAGGAAFAAIPRPRPYDGARAFKSLLWTRLVALGASSAEARRQAAWHPAGRWLERKLTHPGVAALPGAPVDGEVALCRALAELPPAARLDATLDSPASDALSEGPDLGGMPLPEVLGPALSAALAAPHPASAALDAAEALTQVRWIALSGVLGVPPEVCVARRWPAGVHLSSQAWVPQPAVALGLAWLGGAVRALSPQGAPALAAVAVLSRRLADSATEALLEGAYEAIGRALSEVPADHRVQWVASGEAAWCLLRLLHLDPALRDRTASVLLVGGVVGGLPGTCGPLSEEACADWLAAHLRHGQLDVEAVREVPWSAVQWLDPAADPPGAAGLPLANARLPEPSFDEREPVMVDALDLGCLRLDALPSAAALCDALRAASLLRLRTRG